MVEAECYIDIDGRGRVLYRGRNFRDQNHATSKNKFYKRIPLKKPGWAEREVKSKLASFYHNFIIF